MHLAINTLQSERVGKDALESYEQEYHQFNRELKDDIQDSIRDVLLAIADPCCPLHYYKNHRIGINRISFLIGESTSRNEKASGGVREECFRRSARNGIIEPAKTNLQIKIWSPSTLDIEEITETRLYLEMKTFLAIHHMEPTKKKDAIYRLEDANRSIPELDPRAYSSKEIVEKLERDPEFGHKAEVFWKKDADLHALYSERIGGQARKDMLWTNLERTRLIRANRAIIIARIPESKKEHTAIIEAVKAKYIEGTSEKRIEKMLWQHMQNSNEAFGIG